MELHRKKEDLSTNQSYCNYMSTSQAGGRKNYVLCNKFLKFVHSPISFAGGGGIYDLYCSPSTEGAVLGVASPSEEADSVHFIYSLWQVSIIENMNPLITFKNRAVQKKEDLSTNQFYNNYMSTSQAGGRKIHVLCNKFLKFVHSSIGFAGGGGI